MTIFLRILDAAVDEKPSALAHAVLKTREGTKVETVFERAPEAFGSVPGSPFAYWVSETVRETFSRHPALEQHYTATRGAYTTDDFRYYRLTWEAPSTARASKREETLGRVAYVPLAKGGAFSPYYADIHLLVRWHNDGADAKAFLAAYREQKGWGADWSACLNGYSHYFRRGLTWSRRTTSDFGARVLPEGCIFGDKGPTLFDEADGASALMAICGLLNSRVFRYLLAVQLAAADAAARSYEVGLLQRTPIPDITAEKRSLARLVRRAWSLKRSLDTRNETSHAFLLPPRVNAKVTAVEPGSVDRELTNIQAQIDDLAFSLYGIGAEDRATIEAPPKAEVAAPDDGEAEADDADGRDDEIGASGDSDALTSSWLVGVAFGRFDPRLATGERAIPPEPEPFDPLPARSPGMYPEGEEPADRPDILVDDESHADDLAARAVAIAERVTVDLPDNLRAWLAKEFFPLHIKIYSKSRRKAPIYWQLATPSASYSAWLYVDAFSKDTLFRVQNDYIAAKLAHEERRLESLSIELRDRTTVAQRKQLAAQEALVEELRAFLDEVKRVAPLWTPNLDDGVIINFAPLWRLVPQNKAWQKELKFTWDALANGEYDWAQLAMHLWPERVVPKCAKDRSLAIAHGLEDVFWVEGTDGKWTARKSPTKNVDELVKARTSPAVKSALKSLLEAPVARGKSTGRRASGRRMAATAAGGGDA